MLQAFIDDSGRGQGPAFVLSGYLSSVEAWERFSREWQAELDTPPSITYFKMKEAFHAEGQFSGHKPELIEHRLLRLVKIIKAHVKLGFTVALSHKAFNEVLLPHHDAHADHKQKYEEATRSPYFYCFYTICALLLNRQWKRGPVEPIDFIFDEQGKEGINVRMFWDLFKELMPLDEVRTMMPNEPIFRDDKVFLPLQAADMSAWNVRRYIKQLADRTDRNERPIPSAVMTKLAGIRRIDMAIGKKQCIQHVANVERTRKYLESGGKINMEWYLANDETAKWRRNR